MSDLIFVGQFVASKVGATGLTVTVDVDRYTLSDGSRSALVTGGSATEGRRGLYSYRLASADLSLYQYVATFITAGTADQQEIAALGLVVPDALTSSREVAGAAASAAGAVLAAIADVPTVAEFEARTLPSADYTVVSDLPAAPDNASIAAILEDTGTTLPTAISEIALQASVAISATQAEQIAEGMIALAAYADFAQSITATTADNLATAEAFWFCVKARATDADADAVLLLSAADGLVTLAGATYATPANGTLTVFGTAGAWTVAATLTAQATALLTDYAGRHLVAEVKYRLTGGQVKVLWSGTAAISRGVIHRTV